MRLFKEAAAKIRTSPFIIPIGLVFICMFFTSIGISFEDYTTSRLGYIALPTAKANWWIPYLVAALPQLIQIGMVYVFIDDTNKRWSLLFVAMAHLIDLITDVWFKINISGATHWEFLPLALIESWGIYTLGSEVLFTVSTGMLIAILPDFWREISKFLGFVGNAILPMIKFFVPYDNNENKSYQHKESTWEPVNGKKLDFPRHKPTYSNNERRPGRPLGSKNKNKNNDGTNEESDHEFDLQALRDNWAS